MEKNYLTKKRIVILTIFILIVFGLYAFFYQGILVEKKSEVVKEATIQDTFENNSFTGVKLSYQGTIYTIQYKSNEDNTYYQECKKNIGKNTLCEITTYYYSNLKTEKKATKILGISE